MAVIYSACPNSYYKYPCSPFNLEDHMVHSFLILKMDLLTKVLMKSDIIDYLKFPSFFLIFTWTCSLSVIFYKLTFTYFEHMSMY